MARPKVLLTRRWPQRVEAALRCHFEVSVNPADTAMNPGQLQSALSSHDAVLTTVTDRITAEILAQCPMRARLLDNVCAFFDGLPLPDRVIG